MKSNRRAQIIQTAARLFREKGYVDVTMRDLANELDIRASSLYNHIASKDTILSDIVMGLARDFTTHIHQAKEGEGSAIEKLKAIIAMHVDTTYSNSDFLACMNKEWKYLNAQDKKEYVRLRTAYEDDFFAILQEGMESGEIYRGSYPIMGNSILSILRTFYHWYDNVSGLSKEEIKETLYKNLIFGIASASTVSK